MPTDSALQSKFHGVRQYCNADIWPMFGETLHESPRRMEVGFYASEGYQAVNSMRGSGFQMTCVGNLAQILWFGPFSRKYVKDPNHGVPFLTSSSMMDVRPKPEKIISRKHTGHLDRLIIRDGCILISCSGTIGNVALCTKDVDGWACSQDAIRVVVTNSDDLGPVYCYLQSPLGQYLIKRAQTGSVIRHIYEHDVSILPLPRLPRRLRKELSDRIKKANALRVEANRLLETAEKQVSIQNGLDIDASTDVSGFDVFSSSLSTILERRSEEGYQRLDSKFYRPEVLELRQRIKKCQHWHYLNEIALVTLLGKTFVPGVNKVEKGNGTPYFTGKELFASRLIADTFIMSKKKKDIDKLIVTAGTTLVTCAGTTGKVAYVGGHLTGSAVTHDAMRVEPRDGIAGGYLYAFLSSRYGREQLERCSYGSVIPRLHDSQLKRFVVPLPPDRGSSIGEIVDSAFSKFSLATTAETASIEIFLSAVQQGRTATEAEWGEEY